mgnify:CR=1 FL=1
MINIVFLFVESWFISTLGPKISGHTTSSIDGKIYLHGGLTGSAGSEVTNDFWLYDNFVWNKIPFDGVNPSPRMYSASSILDGNFYLFGGWDPETKGSGGSFKSDVWKYNIYNNSWEELACMDETVSRHCAETVNDKIVIHSFRNTLVLKNDKIHVQETTGEKPNGLSMCCSATIGNKMFIFGGSNKEMMINDCLYILDTDIWNWEKIKVKSIKGVSGASMVKYDDKSLLVFGGAYLSQNGYNGGKGLIPSNELFKVYENEKGEYLCSTYDTFDRPEARVANSMNLINNDGTSIIVMHGGWSPITMDTFDETWMIDKES